MMATLVSPGSAGGVSSVSGAAKFGVLRGFVRCGRQHRENCVQQIIDAPAVLRRNGEETPYAQPMEIIGEIGLLLRVHLVDRQKHGLPAADQQAGQLEIGRGEFGAAIDYENDGVGLFERYLCLAKDFRGHEVLVIGENATGIDNAQSTPAPFGLAVEPVPGDAGLVADNRSSGADDAVEERGFADVGAAHDGDRGNSRRDAVGHRVESEPGHGGWFGRGPICENRPLPQGRLGLPVRCGYYRDSVALPSQPVPSVAPRTKRQDGSLYQFFAPGGVLSRTHPAYEFRRGQLQMAQAVEQALEEKRHLIVEAGTGTGKTLAYLVPVIRSGKRIIISTGTKNLQEQLFYKDIPFLEQALFPHGEGKLKVCYMKGRNNYLCRKKLYDLTNQPVLSGLEEIEHYRAIAAWERVTQSGDRAELASLPEASVLWHKLDARSEACLGQKCSAWENCFITEMHRRASESDLIIVNHHLFFADLAIKQQSEYAPDAGILPEVGAVIFDEAHELEDVAGSYFGVSVSNGRIEELCRDVEASLQRNRMLSSSFSRALKSLRERSSLFFALLPPAEGRFAFENRREFLEENGDEFLALQQSLARLNSELEGVPSKPEDLYNFTRRVRELQVQLGFLMESEEPNTVFWIERRRGGRDKCERPPAGHAHRCRAYFEDLFVRQTGVRRADLGHPGGGRRL